MKVEFYISHLRSDCNRFQSVKRELKLRKTKGGFLTHKALCEREEIKSESDEKGDKEKEKNMEQNNIKWKRETVRSLTHKVFLRLVYFFET